MSTIYFHEADGDGAEVRGPERHWAGHVTTSFAIAALDLIERPYLDNDAADLLAASMEPRFTMPANMVATVLRTDPERYSFVTPDGVKHGAFAVVLNTCIDAGSDPIRFLARLHGQCEIHAWVAGPDRAWLAEVIDQGLRLGIMRPEMGWDSVIAMLRRPGGPVVMSYSVTDGFPNRNVAGWEGESEAWYDLPDEERWSLAMAGLRERNVQITPGNLADYGFGSGLNGFQLMHALRDAEGKPPHRVPRRDLSPLRCSIDGSG